MALGAEAQKPELRVYLDYSLPVDVRKVVTIPDLELSYGLASTLVTLGEDGQISSYLAKTWSFPKANQIIFSLDEKARWSDGKPVLAKDVLESFNATKRDFGADLVSLFDSLERIEVIESDRIGLTFKSGVSGEELLKKLTEPMYGVVHFKAGNYDASKTTGPFVISSANNQAILMTRNPHWVFFNEKSPQSIELRRPPKQVEASTLLEDTWPNLVTATSLRKKESDERMHNLKKWQRTLDRLFFLGSAGKGSVDDFRNCILYLNKKISVQKILQSFVGFTPANQIYPKGLPLFSPVLKVNESPVEAPLFSVDVLYSPSRIPTELFQSIEAALRSALPKGVKFHPCALGNVTECLISKKYHLYLGSVGADSINLDGAMSYYFELEPPVVPSGTGNLNFKDRLGKIRQSSNQSKESGFRELLKDVVEQGYILPLFHYSTMAFARENLDLSSVPTSDEVVSFAKVKVIREK